MATFMPAGHECFDSDDDGFEFGDESYEPPRRNDIDFNQKQKPKYSGGFGPHPGNKNIPKPMKDRVPVSRPVHGNQPLDDFRIAVMKGNLPMVKHYIEQGVPVDSVLKTGWTALMYACNYANLEAVSYLLNAKANANYEIDKYSVLMAACSVSRGSEDVVLKCVTMLTDHGADVNAFDRHHMSPVMYAAREGRATVIKKLLESGANINKQDNRGWTALVWASSKGHSFAVRTLLDNKADQHMKCCDGQTAEDIAIARGYEQIVDLLNGTAVGKKSDTAVSHPAQRDEPTHINSSEKLTEPASQEYGDLELFLFGLELGSLVPLFQEQKVTFSAFLKMTDQDLIQMGVTQIGFRKKILNAVQETHKKNWEPSSLPSVQYNKTISTSDAISMLTNISKHTDYIACSFSYILAQVKSHPEILQSQQDGIALNELCRHSDQTLANIQKLYQEVTKLRTHVTKVQGRGDYRPPDLIKSKKNKKVRSMKWRLLGSAFILSGIAVVFYKRHSLLDSLDGFYSR